jgi:hypothetical protein
VLELGLFRDGAVIGTRPRDPLTETKGARPEKKGYKDEAR